MAPEEAKMARMYALRTGIDAYRLPAPPLHGCRNHIAEAARFLRRHAPGSSPAVAEHGSTILPFTTAVPCEP